MKTKEKIYLIRKSLGWSQEVFGAAIDLSQRQYGRIENGECKMSISTFEAICEKWGISHAQFVSLDVEQLRDLIQGNKK